MKYFKLKEFACPCCNQAKMQPSTLELLDKARDDAGVPFIINSGYRCVKHNNEVGGVEDSSHTKGYAADIRVTSNTKDIILKACEKYFNRIGIAERFIHVDNDPDKKPNKRWTY